MLDFSGEIMQVHLTFQKFANVAFISSPIKMTQTFAKPSVEESIVIELIIQLNVK